MQEKDLEMNLQQSNEEPQLKEDEMIQLLSQTVVRQDAEIKELREANKDLKNKLAFDRESRVDKKDIIINYLQKELVYAETIVKELRHHLANYPEDEYSKVDLKNWLLHINYLRALINRL